GQITHLSGEHRADEWAGPGDRREVMAEQHPTVGRHVVLAVLQFLGGGRTVVAWLDDPAFDELRVEAIRDEIGADGGDDEPDRVDLFTADQRDDRPGDGAQDREYEEDDPCGR